MKDTNPSTNFEPWYPTSRQLRLASFGGMAFVAGFLLMMVFGLVASIVAARTGSPEHAANAAVYATGVIAFGLLLLFLAFRHNRKFTKKLQLNVVRETTEQWSDRDAQEGANYCARLRASLSKRWEPSVEIWPSV